MRMVLLTSTPSLFVKICSVTRGRVVVETMTVPGYSRRVAVTSIWHSLVHEIEAGVAELALGKDVVLGVNVCRIVVGTSSVVVNKIEETTVDTIVEAGIWLVMVCVDPG